MQNDISDSDNAVSEVIGVMLMISVTLIIVALVAVYATGAANETEQPVRANLVASEFSQDGDGAVIFDHMSGDSLNLDRLEVSLGARDDPTQHIIIRNNDPGKKQYLRGYTTEDDTLIRLGDRFRLYADEMDKDGVYWNRTGGKFSIRSGHYLTYRFIDRRTGAPVSSGEIMINGI